MLSPSEFREVVSMHPDIFLGNGFSIALSPHADFGNLGELAKNDEFSGRIISDFGTENIEKLLNLLEDFQKLSQFQSLHDLMNQIHSDIRGAFLKALAKIEPQSRGSICEYSLEFTNSILSKFDKVYTTNFDPFLYWAILYREENRKSDGFNLDFAPGKLKWNNSLLPQCWWLHGAIFHFNEKVKDETFKLVSTNEANLIELIQKELLSFGLPTAVLGGTSKQKLQQILENNYLKAAYLSLYLSQKPIVIFGWSNSQNDLHLRDALANRTVFFGVFEPNTNQGRKITLEAELNGWKTFDSAFLPFWKHNKQDFMFCSCLEF